MGCDIVDLRVFSASIAKAGFCERYFSTEEISYCENTVNRVGAYAARFAAKEATVKALGTGFFSEGITPKDVWVEREESKRPLLGLSDKAAALLRSLECAKAEVSLSHHGDYAMAVVVLN